MAKQKGTQSFRYIVMSETYGSEAQGCKVCGVSNDFMQIHDYVSDDPSQYENQEDWFCVDHSKQSVWNKHFQEVGAEQKREEKVHNSSPPNCSAKPIKMKYKVWDKEEGIWADDVYLDWDGSFFGVEDGWGCEGGGGFTSVDQDRYELYKA